MSRHVFLSPLSPTRFPFFSHPRALFSISPRPPICSLSPSLAHTPLREYARERQLAGKLLFVAPSDFTGFRLFLRLKAYERAREP